MVNAEIITSFRLYFLHCDWSCNEKFFALLLVPQQSALNDLMRYHAVVITQLVERWTSDRKIGDF